VPNAMSDQSLLFCSNEKQPDKIIIEITRRKNNKAAKTPLYLLQQ
jgi:hypothetical protein